MGIRGPAPTPTALQIIRGNPGKRPLNKREPKPGEFMAKAPAHLDDDAKKEWRRLVPVLKRMRVLTEADSIALANLCQAYSTMVQAQQQLSKAGLLYKTHNGFIAQSPLLSIVNSSMDLVTKYLREFGLTPAARSRVQTVERPPSDDPWQNV